VRSIREEKGGAPIPKKGWGEREGIRGTVGSVRRSEGIKQGESTMAEEKRGSEKLRRGEAKREQRETVYLA